MKKSVIVTESASATRSNSRRLDFPLGAQVLRHKLDQQRRQQPASLARRPARPSIVEYSKRRVHARSSAQRNIRLPIGGGKFKPQTHAKYLVRNEQALAALTADNRFDPSNIGWSSYEGPRTLDHILHAAAALAGDEKRGLHPLIVNSVPVIDVEVSLARPAEPGKVSSGKERPDRRRDVAARCRRSGRRRLS